MDVEVSNGELQRGLSRLDGEWKAGVKRLDDALSSLAENVSKMSRMVTRLDTLMEEHVKAQKERTDARDRQYMEVTARLKAHEDRLSALEKFRWLLVGGLTVGGAGIGSAATKLLGG